MSTEQVNKLAEAAQAFIDTAGTDFLSGTIPSRYFEPLEAAASGAFGEYGYLRKVQGTLDSYAVKLAKAVERILGIWRYRGQIRDTNFSEMQTAIIRWKAAVEAVANAGEESENFFPAFDAAVERINAEVAARKKPAENPYEVSYIEPRREPTEKELRDEQDGLYQSGAEVKESVIAGLAVHILTYPHGLSDKKTEELLNAVMWCRRGYKLVPLLRPLRERKAK